MKTLYFKCTLLTDVIITQSAATDGHQSTLDFIPGSNFLGICAKEYDKFSQEEQLLMFHTGDVQFGDAHVAAKGIRTLRIPAVMHYPKGKSVEELCYLNFGYDPEKASDKTEQLKQCRHGFYAFVPEDKKAFEQPVETAYAIKSAYDYEKRRSEDDKMYGYESMDQGLEFLFEVRLSDKAEQFEEDIKKYLEGNHRLGKSKTAQYGLVKIEEAKENMFPDYTGNVLRDKSGNEIYTVYADSRLAFIDENTLQPTFRPTAEQLGFKAEDEILWEHSQVRTFQYAPWNNKRQTRDADRCGIEKGSVFVVKSSSGIPSCNVVGQFKNEGFGKVIYNPSFLEYDENKNGLSKWTFAKEEGPKPAASEKIKSTHIPLLRFLDGKKTRVTQFNTVMQTVNAFVDKNKKLFKDDDFSSQWGTIRAYANQYEGKKLQDTVNEYLEHGVASDKWLSSGGKKALDEFMDKCLKGKDNPDLKYYLINLASEMQKALK